MLQDITLSLGESMKLGMTDEKIRSAARQFMEDNYSRIDETSKTMAIDELECNEEIQEKYPQDLLAAFETAIATLEND